MLQTKRPGLTQGSKCIPALSCRQSSALGYEPRAIYGLCHPYLLRSKTCSSGDSWNAGALRRRATFCFHYFRRLRDGLSLFDAHTFTRSGYLACANRDVPLSRLPILKKRKARGCNQHYPRRYWDVLLTERRHGKRYESAEE